MVQGHGQGYGQRYSEVSHGKQTGEVTGQTLLPWLAVPSAVLVTNDKKYNVTNFNVHFKIGSLLIQQYSLTNIITRGLDDRAFPQGDPANPGAWNKRRK